MNLQAEILKHYIANSDNIVFFGGAGVSTESGIPDFRSTDGLYSQKYKHPPEVMLSFDFFAENTAEFYEFYRNKMLHLNAKPNAAHLKLAELEKAGKLKAVITQNIDSLHQKAGSKNVIELHGSAERNLCMSCGEVHKINVVVNSVGIPKCKCGGIIKPDVVLYGEQLDDSITKSAVHYISKADMLIIGGTSLAVYPAAGFIDYYTGDKLVLINKDKTPLDDKADLVIQNSIGEILGMV